jgi:hypothetical protein
LALAAARTALGSGLNETQGDSHGGQLEESQEVGTELVVSSGDTEELFELVEEALDLIALAVEGLSPTKALFSSNHVGNVGDGASYPQAGPKSVGVIGFVGDNDGAAIDIGKKRFRASQVMGLARCNQELDWPALAVDPRVGFRREPTAASPHTAISTLF